MAITGSQHWWKRKEDPHGAVFEAVRTLDERQSNVQNALRDHLGLYLDRKIQDFAHALKSRSINLWGKSRGVHLNVVKSCIDTVSSKIVAHRPKPQFLTIAGRFKDRQKARKLEQWASGLFYREGLYVKHAPNVFLDAAISGTGCVKIAPSESGKDVSIERAWIGEILIDEMSALFADPRVMFQRKYVSREVLIERYPDLKDDIVSAEDVTSEDSTVAAEDVVEVVEAWHLPSRKGAKDGRHVIAIDTATLEDDKYKAEDFPFVFFRWGRNPLGFYGVGLAEELHGIQSEINHLLSRIQEAMKLTATVWVLKPTTTKLSDDSFANKIGSILEYSGHVPPSIETPASMNSQVFEHLWQLYQRAYEISGISQLSASSQKPTGVESGVALRTLLDVETQRFALLARDWEEFFLACTKKAIGVARDVYKSKGGKVKWADKTVVEEIDWADVNLPDDAYVMQIYPVNMLPSTPSGKLAFVQEMMSMQLATPDEAKSLLDFPDVNKFMNLSTASYEDLLSIMDGILYEADYTHPEIAMDLERGILLAQHSWCLGRKEGAPEKNLGMLLEWMEAARALLQQDQTAQAGAMPANPETGEPIPQEMLMEEGDMPGGMPPPTDMMAGGQPPPPPPEGMPQ